jgi:hypothetical protein
MIHLGHCRFFLIIAFQVTTQSIFSQKDSTRQIVEEGWIEQMSDKIVLKFAITNSLEAFTVNSTPSKIELHPNTSTLARIYFNYRIISFYYSYNPKFIPGNDDDSLRGKTRSGGLGISFTFLKSYTDLSYSRTKGYYLANTEDYVTGWKPGDAYIQFPDLVTLNFEGVTGLTLNSRFSQAAIGSQTARQLKSAGTIIPKLLYRYYIVDDQSGAATTQKSNNFQMVLAGGYTHTLVVKEKFYLFGGATLGWGFIHTKLLTRDTSGNVVTRRARPVFHWDGRAGLGYNNQRFFAGIYVGASAVGYREKNVAVAYNNVRAAYQLFVGYRFKAPKFLYKTYDDVMRKVL